MRVFISWSEPQSKVIAEAFFEFIGDMFQSVKPFMSSYMEAGSIWPEILRQELQTTGFGVLCLTKENLTKPWILFEAGALSNALGRGVVCPYLYGVKPTDLQWPLAQFTATSVDAGDSSGTLKVVNAINMALKEKGEPFLEHQPLMRAFNRCWRDYDERLKTVPPLTETEKDGPEFDVKKAFEEILGAVRNRPSIITAGFASGGRVVSGTDTLPKRLRGIINFLGGPLNGQQMATTSKAGGEVATAIFLATGGLNPGSGFTLQQSAQQIHVLRRQLEADGTEIDIILKSVQGPFFGPDFSATYVMGQQNLTEDGVIGQAFYKSA
ncbi:MAG TPA: hypothetical protein VG125_14740 [Pirellulales bacterium]|jgi:hypothetical protein|nr:hypothetical protein [Pirellulales bacterium]